MNHGGDSDSTGAITGNIVGARYGIQVFPERWLEQVELGDVLLSMADDLFEFPRWDLEDEAIEEQISKRYPGF